MCRLAGGLAVESVKKERSKDDSLAVGVSHRMYGDAHWYRQLKTGRDFF